MLVFQPAAGSAYTAVFLTTYCGRAADRPDVRVQEEVRTMQVFKSGKHVEEQYVDLLIIIVVLATVALLWALIA